MPRDRTKIEAGSTALPNERGVRPLRSSKGLDRVWLNLLDDDRVIYERLKEMAAERGYHGYSLMLWEEAIIPWMLSEGEHIPETVYEN